MTFAELEKKRRQSDNWMDMDEEQPRMISMALWTMNAADRCYLEDNLDPNSEGNYLQDFLSEHGEEEISSIKFCGGTPHCAGPGIVFL